MKIDQLRKKNSFFVNGKTLPFIMSKKVSIDIDYQYDLNKARILK